MKDAYIGIDLAIAKRKYLPVTICTWHDGRLIPEPLRQLSLTPPRGFGNAKVLDRCQVENFTRQAAKYIVDVCAELSLSPRCIAIDAPSKPRKEGTRRRAAEAAMDAAGISCFTTPTASEFETIFKKVENHLSSGGAENRIPHANQLWMSVGLEIFKELARVAPCIEVFPQAIVRALGTGQVHKSQAGAVEAQLAEAARYTGWPSEDEDFTDIAFAPSHDRLDAYLSAWVAALPESERVALGVPPDDVIWIPKIDGPKFVKPSLSTTKPKRKAKTSSSLSGFEMGCPACGEHQFKRWPFGWDAHAAHRCAGLESVGADARKAEFKSRYGYLFR